MTLLAASAASLLLLHTPRHQSPTRNSHCDRPTRKKQSSTYVYVRNYAGTLFFGLQTPIAAAARPPDRDAALQVVARSQLFSSSGSKGFCRMPRAEGPVGEQPLLSSHHQPAGVSRPASPTPRQLLPELTLMEENQSRDEQSDSQRSPSSLSFRVSALGGFDSPRQLLGVPGKSTTIRGREVAEANSMSDEFGNLHSPRDLCK